jgi:hypothetical protein
MNLAERIAAWASNEPSVKAIVLIGSRAREPDDQVWQADVHSDWDFHIIASHPELFRKAAWTRNLGLELRTYSVRSAALGGVPKIAALFSETEADFVVLSSIRLQIARWLLRAGFHRCSATFRLKLQDLAVVVRPGWKFLKGSDEWEQFYRKVILKIGDPRLADEDVRSLADGFVCDTVWTLRKIERGELVAAQRMLHRGLAETNIRLLHELRLRRGERSFPEARRAEYVISSHELDSIALASIPEAVSLRAAVIKTSATCRELTSQLIGDRWHWPKS